MTGPTEEASSPGRPWVSPTRRPPGETGIHGSAGQSYTYWSNSKWGVPATPGHRGSPRRIRGQRGAAAAATRMIPGVTAPVPGDLIFQEVQELEDLMRATLGALASFNADEKTILLQEFRRRERKSQERGEYVPPGLCTERQFQKVWAHFSVALRGDHASAFFIKYGCDTEGLLPYEVFAGRLLQSTVRVLGMVGTQKGAYKIGQDASFKGGIKERHCNRVVFPPSNWDGSLARMSSEEPRAGLDLQHVYGYSGIGNTAPNVYFNANAHIVYYVAAIGVVYDPEANTQAFFRDHTEDIKCMAIAPDRKMVATGQIVPQDKGSDKTPFLCIWDSTTKPPTTRQRISFPPEDGMSSRYIAALAFSPDGLQLAVVCADNRHTLTVWDISKPRPTQVTPPKPAFNGQPPQVYGICWNPYESYKMNLTGKDGKKYSKTVYTSFVTYGRRHIKFWTWKPRDERERQAEEKASKDSTSFPEEYRPNLGRFGGLSKKGEKRAVVDDVLSAVWLPSGTELVTGTPSGELLLWDIQGICTKKIPAHGPGVKTPSLQDNIPTFSGVRGLCMRHNDSELVSGGGDGTLKRWDVTTGKLGRDMGTITIEEATETPPAIRALDALPNSTAMVFGTHRCDIWGCSGHDSSTELLLHGQSAKIDLGEDHMAIACNPVRPHIFATASEGPRVYYWNARNRQLVAKAKVGVKVKALAFSQDGKMLAVGSFEGIVKLLEIDEDDRLNEFGQSCRCATEEISAVKFSPSGEFLAVGSHDNFIYILDAKQGSCRTVAKCEGHSSYIKGMDWSIDSRVLMSNCGAYDLLYFDPRTGRKLRTAQNDTRWETWTCTLGFPVMGIWRDADDGTDINAVCRTHPRVHHGDPLVGEPDYVVCARDDGELHLFAYPCVVEDSPERAYTGHSSHITDVHITRNNKWVISVGGRDQAVFQWRLQKEAAPEAPQGLLPQHQVEVYYAPQRKLVIDTEDLPAAAAAATQDIVDTNSETKRFKVEDNQIVYVVSTVTSDIRGAQTTGNVFCTIYGREGEHTAELRLDNHPSNFERGRIDEFEVKGREMKEIDRVRIGHDNTGTAPGWHLARVDICVKGSGGPTTTFLCGKWLAADQGDGKCVRLLTKGGVEVMPKKYKVTTVTSDIRGAGTTGNVYITLFGTQGQSGPRLLDNSAKNFERGRTDVFELFADVGELECIRIGHDNSGLSPGWHLKEVTVSASPATLFIANRWLSTDEDDGSTYVTLYPAGQGAQGQREVKRYRVTTTTSDIRGAGTDAIVDIVIYGQLGNSGAKVLESSKKNFGRGQQDVFILELLDLGELTEIEIGHNNKGVGPGWHLEQVTVLDETEKKTYSFPCDRWLAVDDDDGCIRRRLKPTSQASTTTTYKVVVYTSDLKGAGTDATVHLVMHGKLDGKVTSSQRHLLDTSKNDFERCSIDTFLLKKHPKLGKLTHIVIGHDNKGTGPGWHLQHVEIVDQATGEDYYFPCKRWLAKGEEDGAIERTLHLAVRDPNAAELDYKVTVHTSDIKFAGTDANVSLEIVGERNGTQLSSGVQTICNSKNNFERDQMDVFVIKSPNLGTIKHVTVSHDNSGPGSGWHLDYIDVFDVNTGETIHFAAKRWLSKDESPYQTSATLFPGGAEDETCRYKIVVYTSDTRGAGTDATVSCVLMGSKGQTGSITLENGANNFERGQRDEFIIEAADVGQPEKLQIGHNNKVRANGIAAVLTRGIDLRLPPQNGKGLGPAWHLQHVEVHNQRTNARAFFVADQWLDAKKGTTTVTLESSTGQAAKQVYQLKVVTADCRGAGTDADISVILHGESGSTDELPLETSANNFERNTTDEFLLNLGAKEIGDIKRVDIGFASKQSAGGAMGSLVGIGWCLQSCEVFHTNTQRRFFFPHGDWLNKSKKRVVLEEGHPGMQVQYKVVVKTSDLRGAGTDSNVSIVVNGVHEGKPTTSGSHKLDNSANNFERNMTDTFYLTCKNLGTLENIQIASDGRGLGAAWHLDHVEVWNMNTGECTVFSCGEWLTPKDPMSLQKTLVAGASGKQLDEYRVWVYTSDIRGAGTDANVTLEIVGDMDKLPPRRLDSSANDFERGQRNEFVFRAVDVGEIKSITIGHDNSGVGPGWHLEMVEIEHKQQTTRFLCNEWLQKGKNGLADCQKQLFPGSAAAQGTAFKVTVNTSDVRGAGTDSNITCVIYCQNGDTGVRKLDSSSNDFERGSSCTFMLQSPNIGPIQAVRISSDGGGFGAEWHLKDIQVTDTSSGETLTFPFSNWIDKKNGLSHLLTPDRDGDGVGDARPDGLLVDYVITVHTSDLRGAGTDANVSIELHGDKGSVGETRIDNNQNNFERDRRDVFKITASNVGELDHIVIKHDNSGFGPDWHLASVEVTHSGLNKTYVFPCNDWLRKTKEAGLAGCCKTLRQGGDVAGGPTQYRVTVVTSDLKGAGTDSNVSVVLYGSKGDTGEQKLDTASNNFERNKVDTFYVKANDIGEMQSLRITSDGSRLGSAWHLDRVEVHSSATNEILTFPFRGWIDREHGLSHLLYPDRDGDGVADVGTQAPVKDYRVYVYTSDLRGAGTDANVFIELHGDKGHIGSTKMDNSANNFERGRKDSFDVKGMDIGEMTSVVIRHDNKGRVAAWHLGQVEVVHPFNHKIYFFPCNEWLQKTKEEGMDGCKRTLVPGQGGPGGGRQFKVAVHTSDIKGAGTDSNIKIVLVGDKGSTEPMPLDTSANNFERAMVDNFFLKTPDIGAVQKVKIISDGRGLGAAWHLDRVEVTDTSNGETSVYRFRGWIDKKHGLEHEILPTASGSQCAYRVKTYTSDIKGSGTDAKVEIEVVGDKGGFGPCALDTKANNFERAMVDEFEIVEMDVGEILHISIGHDNSGAGAAWHLQQVEIFHPILEKTYYFPCNEWLEKESCKKTLKPGSEADGGPVQYRVTVHTTDCRGAGTDSDISCIVYGAQGDTGTQKLDNSTNNFEKGQVDTFLFMAPNVGSMHSMKVTSNGRGVGAAWHLSHIEVANTGTGEQLVFPFHGWIDSKHGLEHLLQPDRDGDGRPDQPDAGSTVEYDVQVFTSDIRGAATSAEVFIEMFGTNGCIGATRLENDPNNFSRGRRDAFKVQGMDVGDITHVAISHDNSGLTPDWHCQQVEVLHPVNGQNYVFPCAAWLKKTKADGMGGCRKELHPGSSGDGAASYKVRVYTSDIKYAGTDSDVSVTVIGDDGDTGSHDLLSSANDFERAAVGSYFFTAPNVGRMKKLKVSLKPRGLGVDWHLSHMEVLNSATGEALVFPYGDWLTKANSTVILLPQASGDGVPRAGVDDQFLDYQVTVYTADDRGSATNSKIWISLNGSNGFVGEALVNPKGEQLAAGKKHECKLHGMDVGEVQSIGVRSDQSGLGAKWKLQQVEVRKPDGTLFTFPFDSWVEGKEAIQISEARHALAPASEEPQRFKLVAWTSDIQFAGTDSNVYLELWGNEGNASGKSAVHLNNRTNNFERGTEINVDMCSIGREDAFFFDFPPEKRIGPQLQKVALSKTGGMFSGDWHLDNFTLSDMSNNKIYKFECRAWFNKKEGLRKEWARGGGSGQALRLVSEAPLAAAGVEGATAALRASPPGVFPGYRVAILPQSTAGAGTDSGVHVELQMDRGTLDAFYPGGLEPGQACEVTVPSRNGDLQGLRSAKVWTDGSGSQKTFGMSSLSVTNLATQQRWFVDHNDEVTPDGVFLQPRHRAAPASPHGGWEKCTAPHPGNPNFEVTFFHNRATGESTYERPAEYGGDGESDSSDIYPTRSWMQQNMASMSPTAAPSGNDASMPPGATGQAAAKSPVDQTRRNAVDEVVKDNDQNRKAGVFGRRKDNIPGDPRKEQQTATGVALKDHSSGEIRAASEVASGPMETEMTPESVQSPVALRAAKGQSTGGGSSAREFAAGPLETDARAAHLETKQHAGLVSRQVSAGGSTGLTADKNSMVGLEALHQGNGGWQKLAAPHPHNPRYEVTFYHNHFTGESTYERPPDYIPDHETDASDIYPPRSWASSME